MTPTAKVTAVGAAGALTTLVTFIAEQLGANLPDTAIAAITAVALFAAGYLRGEHDDPGEHAVA